MDTVETQNIKHDLKSLETNATHLTSMKIIEHAMRIIKHRTEATATATAEAAAAGGAASTSSSKQSQQQEEQQEEQQQKQHGNNRK